MSNTKPVALQGQHIERTSKIRLALLKPLVISIKTAGASTGEAPEKESRAQQEHQDHQTARIIKHELRSNTLAHEESSIQVAIRIIIVA